MIQSQVVHRGQLAARRHAVGGAVRGGGRLCGQRELQDLVHIVELRAGAIYIYIYIYIYNAQYIYIYIYFII